MSSGEYTVTKCNEHYFCGTISVKDNFNTILTTIPYDKGWQVTAGRSKIETYKVLDSLLAFDLPTGEYTLELNYMPKEYTVGATISMFGLFALVSIMAVDEIIKRKHKEIILQNDKE